MSDIERGNGQVKNYIVAYPRGKAYDFNCI